MLKGDYFKFSANTSTPLARIASTTAKQWPIGVLTQNAYGVGDHVQGIEISYAAKPLKKFYSNSEANKKHRPTPMAIKAHAVPEHQTTIRDKVLRLIPIEECRGFRWRGS
jgi:hypothetical protein